MTEKLKKNTPDAASNPTPVREMLEKAFGGKSGLGETVAQLYEDAYGHEQNCEFAQAHDLVSKAIGLLREDGSKPELVPQFVLYEAKLLYYLERNEEALESFDYVLKGDPKSIYALYFKGLTLKALDRFPEAMSLFRDAYEIDSTNPCCIAGMAITFAFEGKKTEALALLEQADPGKGWRGEILDTKGTLLFELGRYSESLAIYDKLVLARPLDVGTHHNRGAALAALGRHSEAVVVLNRAIELDPTHYKSRLRKAVCLIAIGDKKEAAEAFRSIGPKRVFPYISDELYCAVQLGNCENSLILLNELMGLDGENPELHLLAGIALIGAGDMDKGPTHVYFALTHLLKHGKLDMATEALKKFAGAFQARGEDAPAQELLKTARASDLHSEERWKLKSNIRYLKQRAKEEAKKKEIDANAPANPKEKRLKSMEKANGRLAEAKASLGASEEKLKRLEIDAVGAEALAEGIAAKVSFHQLVLAKERGISSETEAKRKLEQARNECKRLEGARNALGAKIEACDCLISTYTTRHGLNGSDDSVLLGHIRSHMKRGAQREKLEKCVEQRRQLKSQEFILSQQAADAKAHGERLEQAISPFIGLASERDTAQERLLDIRQQIEGEKKASEALRKKISELEAKANGER